MRELVYKKFRLTSQRLVHEFPDIMSIGLQAESVTPKAEEVETELSGTSSLSRLKAGDSPEGIQREDTPT